MLVILDVRALILLIGVVPANLITSPVESPTMSIQGIIYQLLDSFTFSWMITWDQKTLLKPIHAAAAQMLRTAFFSVASSEERSLSSLKAANSFRASILNRSSSPDVQLTVIQVLEVMCEMMDWDNWNWSTGMTSSQWRAILQSRRIVHLCYVCSLLLLRDCMIKPQVHWNFLSEYIS